MTPEQFIAEFVRQGRFWRSAGKDNKHYHPSEIIVRSELLDMAEAFLAEGPTIYYHRDINVDNDIYKPLVPGNSVGDCWYCDGKGEGLFGLCGRCGGLGLLINRSGDFCMAGGYEECDAESYLDRCPVHDPKARQAAMTKHQRFLLEKVAAARERFAAQKRSFPEKGILDSLDSHDE